MLSGHTLPILHGTLFLGCFAAALTARAQEPPEIGTHVVRESETLESIAAYYLGDAGRWREIWDLNRDEIADPDLIFPGDKLAIDLPEQLPQRAAKVAKYRRRVEEERAPRPVERVAINDLLRPLDVVQTYDGASTELRFGDETRLTVTEQSRVILGGAPTDPPPVDRRQIEIVVGQADIKRRARAGPPDEIEILMGATVVTPRPEAGGDSMDARTRRPGGQGAQLMVYAGTSGIAAAGTRFDVAQGMGTTVVDGEPPAPPEKLLEAPGITRPEPGARIGDPDPVFAWLPVVGGVSYTLEICHDEDCGELERRATEIAETSWRGGGLPVGSYYWRVTARSPSGLDGFPSTPAELTILAGEPDRVAPRASLGFTGPMVGVAERLVLGVGAAVRAEVSDDDVGLAEWTRLLDGEATTEEGWTSASWSSGPHTVSVVAVDLAGNRTSAGPESFVYDPDPPVVRWGIEDGPDLGQASGLSGDSIEGLGEMPGRRARARRSPLMWTSSGIKWIPMGYGDWKISSDEPYIVLRARARRVTLATIGETVTRRKGLWVQAADPGCGVESMSYQILAGPAGELALVVRAVDALDNETRIAWRLTRD